MFKRPPKMRWSRFLQTRSNTSISAGARPSQHEVLARSATPSKILPSTTSRTTHDGWENGDGAYGEFTFDTTTRSITLAYNERFTDSIYSEHEF